MPSWQDEALVLGAQRFGETGLILSLFSQEHGRHLGLFHSKQIPLTGSLVNAKWHARLAEHLGSFKIEQISALSIPFLDDRKRLSAIDSLCYLLNKLLAEREKNTDFYNFVFQFLSHLAEENWQERYILFELELLKVIGFGLDLSSCAGGGNSFDLAYVSPKSGRAVSKEKGEPYKDKLLILPPFLWKNSSPTQSDLKNGLALTGYFLQQHLDNFPITRNNIL